MITYEISEEELSALRRVVEQLGFVETLLDALGPERPCDQVPIKPSHIVAFLDSVTAPLEKLLGQATERAKVTGRAHSTAPLNTWELRCILQAMRDGPARIGRDATTQIATRLLELAPHDDDMMAVLELWLDMSHRAGNSGELKTSTEAEPAATKPAAAKRRKGAAQMTSA